MQLGEAFYRAKSRRFRHALDAASLDGILLLDVHNVIYASGFFHIPSERPLGMYIPEKRQAGVVRAAAGTGKCRRAWIGDIRTYFEYPGEEHPVVWMVRETGARHVGHRYVTVDVCASWMIGWSPRPLVDADALGERAGRNRAGRKSGDAMPITVWKYVRDHAADIIRAGGTELRYS